MVEAWTSVLVMYWSIRMCLEFAAFVAELYDEYWRR